jgi:hypothetical protein
MNMWMLDGVGSSRFVHSSLGQDCQLLQHKILSNGRLPASSAQDSFQWMPSYIRAVEEFEIFDILTIVRWMAL